MQTDRLNFNDRASSFVYKQNNNKDTDQVGLNREEFKSGGQSADALREKFSGHLDAAKAKYNSLPKDSPKIRMPFESTNQLGYSPKENLSYTPKIDTASTAVKKELSAESLLPAPQLNMLGSNGGTIGAAVGSGNTMPAMALNGRDALVSALMESGVNIDLLSKQSRVVLNELGKAIDTLNQSGPFSIADAAKTLGGYFGVQIKAEPGLVDADGQSLLGYSDRNGTIVLNSDLENQPDVLRAVAFEELAEQAFQRISRYEAGAGNSLPTASADGFSKGDFGNEVSQKVSGTWNSLSVDQRDSIRSEVDTVTLANGTTVEAAGEIELTAVDAWVGLSNTEIEELEEDVASVTGGSLSVAAASTAMISELVKYSLGDNWGPFMANLRGAFATGFGQILTNAAGIKPNWANIVVNAVTAGVVSQVGATLQGFLADAGYTWTVQAALDHARANRSVGSSEVRGRLIKMNLGAAANITWGLIGGAAGALGVYITEAIEAKVNGKPDAEVNELMTVAGRKIKADETLTDSEKGQLIEEMVVFSSFAKGVKQAIADSKAGRDLKIDVSGIEDFQDKMAETETAIVYLYNNERGLTNTEREAIKYLYNNRNKPINI